MSAEAITVLRSVDGAIMTKVITGRKDGFSVRAYDRGYEFAIEQIIVGGIVELGQALTRLEADPHACVIRGRPLPGTDLSRARRLVHDQIEDDSSITPATFEPAARAWIALDFDDLPAPEWDADALARRRAAIARDRLDHPIGPPLAKTADQGEDHDLEADGDPAPIDAVRDWTIVIRAVLITLPAEFHDAHAWFQFTSQAGISDGIRLRLWFWLDRPVSDAEAKRWLADAPVDCALYSPVQPHYVARPIFKPRSADPVPRRSGFWWRWDDQVAVPALPEPEPAPTPAYTIWTAANDRRAATYVQACLHTVQTAGHDQRRPALRQAAIVIFGFVEHGLIAEADAWAGLRHAADCHRWPTRRRDDLLAWARAFAADRKPLPIGFR